MRLVQYCQALLVDPSPELQRQKWSLIYVNWNKKIQEYLHGKYAIAYLPKAYAIKIMYQALVQYLEFYEINWDRLIMPAIQAIIILISIVQFIHHIRIHHCDRQQLVEVRPHRNRQLFPAHIVGLRPIRSPIFWLIIRQFFAEHVQVLCLCRHQHNTKFRPIIKILQNSLRTMAITCICKIIVYNCITVTVTQGIQRIIYEEKKCYRYEKCGSIWSRKFHIKLQKDLLLRRLLSE